MNPFNKELFLNTFTFNCLKLRAKIREKVVLWVEKFDLITYLLK